MDRLRAGRDLLIAAAVACGSSAAVASPLSATVIASFQSELGCAGDFDLGCDLTALMAPAFDTVWRRTLGLPNGDWSYKVAIDDGSAGLVPRGPNLPLALRAPGEVRFYFDEATSYVTDNVTSVIATLAGSFQSELGCGSDFDPSCLRSWLTDPDGDGTLTFATDRIAVGTHSVVVAHDEDLSEVYGPGGALNSGRSIFFEVGRPGTTRFRYDSETHILRIATGNVPAPVPLPASALLLAGGLLGLGLMRRARRG